jgi:hypothetical protein
MNFEEAMRQIVLGMPPAEDAGLLGISLDPADSSLVIIPVHWEATTSYGGRKANAAPACGKSSAPSTASTATTTPASTDTTTKPADAEQKAPETKDAAGSTATPDAKDEEVVCKKVEKATGSRIGTKRVCMTRREWREYEEE